MTTLEELSIKHSEIKEKLANVAESKINKGKVMVVCKQISETLEVSPQTVYNYITGSIKDGYLAEAIYKEFKRLKQPN